MTDCCTSSKQATAFPKTHTCPSNGKTCNQVSPTTIMHHIQSPWEWHAREQGYYFCPDPDCEVVYFGEDNTTIDQSALRTRVGVKQVSDDATLCYCYGVTRSDALGNPTVRQFVVEQTRLGQCACNTRNPSGKCCLADFPEHHNSVDT